MDGNSLSTNDLLNSMEEVTIHDHLCCIYDSDEQRLPLIVSFLKAGLDRGEKNICIAEQDFAHQVRERLQKEGMNVAEALASGALSFPLPEDVYLPASCAVNGRPHFSPRAVISRLEEMYAAARGDGFSALRLTGTIPWYPDNKEDLCSLLEYESRLHAFFTGHQVIALCQYGAGHLPPDILRQVVLAHPGFFLDGKVYQNPFYASIPGSHPVSEAVDTREFLVRLKLSAENIETLKQSEENLKQLINQQADGIIVVDQQKLIRFVNPAALDMFDVTESELIGRQFGFAVGERAEIEILRPGLKRISAEMRVTETLWSGERVFLISLRDITSRKANEQALYRANRAMRITSRFRRLVMHAVTESELLDSLCRFIIQEAGYRMAWIGYVRDDPGKTVEPVAQAGCEKDYLARIKISWADNEHGQGPTGMAIRSGEPAVCQEIAKDSRFSPWREEARRCGYGSSVSLPLIMEGGYPVGALNIYAEDEKSFDDREVEFLKELAHDLAHAIRHLRLQEEKSEVEVELERSEAYSGSIIENSLDLITIINRDGSIHYQSPSSEDILGYSPEEIVSRDVFDYIHPDDREKAGETIGKVLNNPDRRYASELRVQHKNGGWRNLEAMATHILDQDGASQVLVNSRDITTRIWTEGQLRQKAHDLEERVKELNCLLAVANILWNTASGMAASLQQIVDLIPPALQYPHLACARLMLAGKEYRTDSFRATPLHLRSEIRVNGKSAGFLEFCYVWSGEEGEEPDILPEEQNLLDGVVRQIEGAVYRQQVQEELLWSEEKYRTLFETMAQGVVYQDAEGKVISANPAASRILGLDMEELVSRNSLSTVWQALDEQGNPLPGRDHPPMVALRERREVKNRIMAVFKPDEQDYRWISVNSVPQWRNGEEQPFQVYSTFEDITDLKKTSEELSYRITLEQLISEISTRFINLPLEGIDREINRALGRVGQFVGVDRSYVFLLSEDGGAISNSHEWCADGVESQIDILQDLPVACLPWWMEKIRRFEPVFISSVEEMPEESGAEKKLFGELDISALLCVPMTYGGEFKGFLGFDLVQGKKNWSARDISLLRMLGEIFILALEHKNAEEQLELMSILKVREMFLDNFRILCRDAREDEPIFESAASWLAHHLELDRCSVWMLEEGGVQVCRKLYIAEEEGFRVGAEVQLNPAGNYLGSLANPDRTLAIEDAGTVSGYPDLAEQYLRPVGVKSLLIAPFTIREKVSGVLFLEQVRAERVWQPDEAQLAKRVADQIAIACHLIRERKLREKQQQEYTVELERRVVQRTVELEEARKEAEAASQAKSEFLANMSHELRTPLNSVLGFAEVVRDNMAGPTTEQQREYLGDIMESGKHLLNLINDVLDLSKVEAGAMELQLENILLDELFEQCLTMFREKALKHAIGLRLEIVEGTAGIVADRRKLMQVMVNLLSNALKFTPDGGEIGIRTDRNGGLLAIEVWDTGIGIAREDQKRLFQPFQQLETGRSRKYQGTGLGLSLCKNIVKLHGGNIRVESSPGRGSSFIISLPVDPLQAEEEGLQPEEKELLPRIQIQGLTFGIHNLDRCLTLHKNWEMGFALFNLVVGGVKGVNEVVSLAEILRKEMRSRDIIIYDQVSGSYFLVLSGLETTSAEDTLTRFINYLRDEGYESEGSLVFFPEDGRSREELLTAIAGRKKKS